MIHNYYSVTLQPHVPLGSNRGIASSTKLGQGSFRCTFRRSGTGNPQDNFCPLVDTAHVRERLRGVRGMFRLRKEMIWVDIAWGNFLVVFEWFAKSGKKWFLSGFLRFGQFHTNTLPAAS